MRLPTALLAILGFSFLASLSFAQSAPAKASGDAAKGKRLFAERCSACHAISMDGSALGPNLSSLVGRHAAAVPGFNYSKALRDSKLAWNEAMLAKYLANPEALVPGTTMSVKVTVARERNDLIAFLRTVEGPAIQPAHTNSLTQPIVDSNDLKR